MAKLVAHVLASFLGSNIDISQNYKMGDMSRGVAKKNYGGELYHMTSVHVRFIFPRIAV